MLSLIHNFFAKWCAELIDRAPPGFAVANFKLELLTYRSFENADSLWNYFLPDPIAFKDEQFLGFTHASVLKQPR